PRCLRFAGWVAPPPRKTRFWLLVQLCQAGFIPAGFQRKVSEFKSLPPSQSLPDARTPYTTSWARNYSTGPSRLGVCGAWTRWGLSLVREGSVPRRRQGSVGFALLWDEATFRKCKRPGLDLSPGRLGSFRPGRLACPRLHGLLRMLCAGLHILRHLGTAQLLVDRLRLLALALSSEHIGTAKQAFAYGDPIGLGRAREGFLQGGDGVDRADPAQGPRRGLHDFGIWIVEPLDQRSNSLGISPHADAADDAD